MKFIDPQHDPWQTAVGEDRALPSTDTGHLLTLEQWHAVREQWPQDARAGVLVPNDADIESLEPDLPRLTLVALQFPKWVDGRAYSQARLLRCRLRYRGEVRAMLGGGRGQHGGGVRELGSEAVAGPRVQRGCPGAAHATLRANTGCVSCTSPW